MKALKKIFKCKFLGEHDIEYFKGYGHRCSCCGKTVKEIHRKGKYNANI